MVTWWWPGCVVSQETVGSLTEATRILARSWHVLDATCLRCSLMLCSLKLWHVFDADRWCGMCEVLVVARLVADAHVAHVSEDTL